MPKHSSTVDSFNVINIGSTTDVVQLNPHIGIGTNNPSVSVEINTTDSIKIPKGNTSERPPESTDFNKGLIRYNTELDQFEGFGAGNRWRSLESVIDNDQDTYITAKNSAEDNDELKFYTAAKQHMIIKSDGNIGIGTENPNNKLHVEGDIKFTGNLYKNLLTKTEEPEVITNNLIVHYKFDGDTNDSSGNNQNITLTTGTIDFHSDSVIGKSCLIQNNEYCEISTTLAIDTLRSKIFTVSFWVKLNALGTLNYILGGWDNAASGSQRGGYHISFNGTQFIWARLCNNTFVVNGISLLLPS